MFCSTVIATYNRAGCIERAIQSALDVLPQGEVVVVDDASTDTTLSILAGTFSVPIANGQIKLVVLSSNQGVSAAKNAGYIAASGDWVIFLDSDDWYKEGVGTQIMSELQAAKYFPIVFFRCVDQDGHFVGLKQNESCSISLSCYLENTSFGEALTAINKVIAGHDPPYVANLRGYEGLGCARIIDRYGDAMLSSLVARVYDKSGSDRLSRSMVKRMPLLVKGHSLLLKEFWRQMSFKQRVFYVTKIIAYSLLGELVKLKQEK